MGAEVFRTFTEKVLSSLNMTSISIHDRRFLCKFHEEFEFTRVLSITRFNCSQILSAATESSQL